MAYVYIYLDPRKSPPEPIYVGKGRGKRMFHHRYKTCDNSILNRKINNILKKNMDVIIEKVKDNISDEEAMRLEIELILKFGRITKKTGTLCNFTEGGEGTYGYKHKKKTLKLFSKQRKNKKQTQAQYKANCSRKISESTREKIRKSQIGHNRHTPEQIAILKRNQFNAKRFLVTFPNGEKKEIINLRKFCKEQGLDRTSATKSATANVPYKNYVFVRL